MNIRKRFLIAILGIALSILLIFGGVAYHIAKDAETLKESQLLRTEIKEVADALSDVSVDEETRNRNFRFLTRIHKPHTYVLIMRDKQDNIVSDSDILPPISQLHEELAQIGPPEAIVRSGTLTMDGQDYPWAAAPLRQDGIELLMIHKPRMADTPLIQTIAARFFIAGLIVIWIAVWTALILSSIISKRIQAHNDELQHRASHDDLTQLPNRSLLNQRMEQALADASGRRQTFALLVMDLDRFKEINDTLGHQVGDELLLKVGQRISTTLRGSDTIARLGGDEFALLLINASVENAIACARRIAHTLDQPFDISDMKISIRSSIGIAMYPKHGRDAETLLKHADIAMYQAKQNNFGFSVYNAQHDSFTVQRLALARDLQTAIEQKQLLLQYQPKIDIASGSVNGVEALVRWQHPEHGMIPPDEFIGIAEQNGLIDSLTREVIKTAIRQCCRWREAGLHIKIAINLSPRNLHNPKLPEWIEEQLNQYRLPAGMLELELTENAVMVDIQCASKIFRQLSELGIPLSIDDFGTGMSSLSYLSRLPVSKLKIDRSFVMDMDRDESKQVIVRSTIDLAHNLGYQVIAEGVETMEVLRLLKRLHCDCAQGYFFSPPLAAEKLEAWLQESGWALPAAPESGDTSATQLHRLRFN